MIPVHKSNVLEVATNKPNAATAFQLPDTAPAGFRPFASAYANGTQIPIYAHDGTDSVMGANWEWSLCTFTSGVPNTLVRSQILESSNGNTAVDFSGSANFPTLTVGFAATLGTKVQALMQAVTPGGRLTLESGVPISTTDQTAKTTLYYTPYLHNIIVLWDGFQWCPVEFTETSLALGTLTANIGYDVFAVLSGGTLTLELSAWSSETARDAGALVTLQDGRYCKDGDRTRLLLGSFYTATATTTEDSITKSYLHNFYNQIDGYKKNSNTTSHSYSTNAYREWNGATTIRCYHFNGNVVPITTVAFGIFQLLNISTTNATGHMTVSFNSTTASVFGNTLVGVGTAFRSGAGFIGQSQIGLNFVTVVEYGLAGVTYQGAYLGYVWKY